MRAFDGGADAFPSLDGLLDEVRGADIMPIHGGESDEGPAVLKHGRPRSVGPSSSIGTPSSCTTSATGSSSGSIGLIVAFTAA